MTNKQASFCKILARGDLNQTEAYIQAGFNSKNPGDSASRLMMDPKIRAEVEKHRRKYAEKTTTDATWIRKQLMEVIAKSGLGEEIMVKTKDGLVGTGEFKYDSAGVNKAIDILNRMNGHYELDNKQKQVPIQIDVKF